MLSPDKSDAQGSLSTRASLGEILVRLGIITVDQLAEALPHCDSQQRNLLQVVSEMGFAPEEKVLKAISVRQQVPYFTTFHGILEHDAAKLLPQKMARKFLVLPVRKTKKGLMLAMVNPVDIIAIDMAGTHTGLKVLPVLTTRKSLFEAIHAVWGGEAPATEADSADGADRPPEAAAGAPETAEAPPEPSFLSKKGPTVKLVPLGTDQPAARAGAHDESVVEIVNNVIGEAVAAHASDIHLEPAPNSLRFRMRVDGMMRNRGAFRKELESAIVARIKILSRLDITEVRLPQDGHIAVDYGGRSVDLRVSTLPTVYGEKTVIRVLDQANSRRSLADLGLPSYVMETFSKVIRAPMGLVLVTGPTGSGKTTTLYAALATLTSDDKNVVTLEDPVEYRLPGINQVETNHRIGLTFANGLRSILRQDPNVILIGEIRDLETAEIAVQASITGHFVLSTLHTKDAVNTIARLLNMKIEPYLLSVALSGVVAQRLVRVLCAKCKALQMPTKQEVGLLGVGLAQPGPFYAPAGCEACMGIGYQGRVGIYEWLVINRELRGLITSSVPADDLRAAAKSSGMKSLQEAGLEKVYAGLTSLAEVVRVTHEQDFELKPAEEGKA